MHDILHIGIRPFLFVYVYRCGCGKWPVPFVVCASTCSDSLTEVGAAVLWVVLNNQVYYIFLNLGPVHALQAALLEVF